MPESVITLMVADGDFYNFIVLSPFCWLSTIRKLFLLPRLLIKVWPHGSLFYSMGYTFLLLLSLMLSWPGFGQWEASQPHSFLSFATCPHHF